MKKVYTLIFALIAFLGADSQTIFSAPVTDGTFTISSSASAVARTAVIRMWGGGGGGADANGNSTPGGGGSAGGYVETFSIVLPPGRYTYTVGSGGAAGSNGTVSSITFPDGKKIIASFGRGASGATGGAVSDANTNTTTFLLRFDTTNTAPGSNAGGSNGGDGRASITRGCGCTPPAAGTYPNPAVTITSTAGVGNGDGNNGTAGVLGAGGGGGKKSNNNPGRGAAGGAGRIQIDFQTGNAAPLPVTFGTIKAFEKGTGVQVDWTSYSELNIANYQVERSADGINFTSIGEVAPRNVTDATNYNFFDALPLSGTSFYRIRNNDIDGKSGLSTIVKVNLNKNIKTINVYPNPVRGNRVSFQTSDLAKGLYNVEVYNTMGSRVFSQALNHAGGAITQTLSLPTLQSGSYTLRINGTSSSSIHKITILQ